MGKKRIMKTARLDEISLVDCPAQAGAKIVLRKRDTNILPQDDAGRLNKGTNPGTTPAVNGGNQENRMTPEEKAAFEKAANDKLVEMQKRAERAEQIATLTDGQKGLFAKMDSKEQDSFLALKPEDRQAEVAKALDSNPVVYKTADGEEFRKNDDPRLVAMAKRADADRKARIDAETVTKRERLAKRAEGLTLKGDLDTKIALIEALDAIPVEKRAKVEELLKGAEGAVGLALETRGTSGEQSTEGVKPEDALQALAKKHKDANPKLSDAEAYMAAVKSDEGKALYRKHLGV